MNSIKSQPNILLGIALFSGFGSHKQNQNLVTFLKVNLLKVTGYSLLINVHEKILPSFCLCRIQTCMRLTLLLKKVALACNSCIGWVGGACNLIAVLPVNSLRTSTNFGVSYFLLEEHLTVYYTVLEFYEDRCWAARRVFAETTYRF